MTIIVEAYRVACVSAREHGHALPTATDVAAILRRWSYITSVARTRGDCTSLLLPLADADPPRPPDRARKVAL